jgi:hypothetical protein
MSFPVVEFSKPKCIAYFSLMENKSKIAFSKWCQATLNRDFQVNYIDYDLNQDMQDTSLLESPIPDDLTNIKAALSHFKCTQLNNTLITWRGILTRILLAHTENGKEPIWLVAYRKGSCVYLHEERKEIRKFHPSMHWGKQFEKIISHSTIVGEYCEVFSAKLNGINLVYGAEMDALWEERGEIVELKTCLDYPEAFHRKRAQYWAQCYLVGIEKLIVGFRSRKGRICRIQVIESHPLRSHFDYKRLLGNLNDFCARLMARMQNQPEDLPLSISYCTQSRAFTWN